MGHKFRIAEIVTDTKDVRALKLLKQVGVNEVVGVLPRNYSDWRMHKTDEPWSYASLASLKKYLSEFGFKLVAIEDNPPMDFIRYGLEGKEEELENVLNMIENMGKLGINVWCYNWMAGIGWVRSRTNILTRGDAVTTAFYMEDMEDYPAPQLGNIDSDKLWATLKWFLERVIPVAEEYGVNLAMHPDDPPVASLRGVARIMNTIDSFRKLLKIYDSPKNGITLCQGNFTLMTNDLPSVIREFVSTGRVFFVHFRDVEGKPEHFYETFIDQGKTNMAQCMKAYLDAGFSGIMRTDHTPTLYGDNAVVPGYSILGRLHAIGYIQGLLASIEDSNDEDEKYTNKKNYKDLRTS